MIEWRAYNVIAVTDKKNNPSKSDFELSTSAFTYCTPNTVFWLSERGLEIPTVEFIFFDVDVSDWPNTQIEFEWDGGRYVGTFAESSIQLRWANGQICTARIHNISSL